MEPGYFVEVSDNRKMNNYIKGKRVEEPFLESQIPIKGLPEDFLWMRVNPGTKMRNVLELAMNEVNTKGRRVVLWSGSGPAVDKVISCVEIMKRQHPEPFHQVNRICYRKVQEHWDPLLENLDPLVVERELPTIHILLSKDPVETTQPGYQAPGPKSNPKRGIKGREKAVAQKKKPQRRIDCETFESFGLQSTRTRGTKLNQRRGNYNTTKPNRRGNTKLQSQKSNTQEDNFRKFPLAKEEKLKDYQEADPSGS